MKMGKQVRRTKVLVCLLVCLFLLGCETQSIKAEPLNGNIETHIKSPADVYVSLGVEYMGLGMPEVALEKLTKAIAIDPASSDAHNVLAVLYSQLGELPLANRHFEKAISIQPFNSSALNNYAGFLCDKGGYIRADKYFQRALKNPLYKGKLKALTNAGICALKNNKVEAAESYFLTSLRHNKRYGPALYQMAALRLRQEKYLSVRAYLQRFRETQKHTSGSLWLGIQAAAKLNKQGEVASYAIQLKNFFPDSPEARLFSNSNINTF